MQRLLSKEMLEKYLIKRRVINGKSYETIFEYSGVPVTDGQGEEIAHEVIVGFRKESGEVHTGSLYLPIVMPNGLLMRNKTTWYPVKMVIPPIKFHERPSGKVVSHLHALINVEKSASSLDDFFPTVMTSGLETKSPLMQELATEESVYLHDLYNWIVVDIEMAVIELFNHKIFDDMSRSQFGGFKGISASIRALHTLVKAFSRFKEEEDETAYKNNEWFYVVPEEMDCLGSVSLEDKRGAVVLHEYVKRLLIEGEVPVDFCSCSQSMPMRTARIKDGVRVENAKFVGTPSFPYTRWRRAIAGITSDDPRRVIVSRSVSRAMRLDEPDLPLAPTDVELGIDAVSLPGVRMTHPLNHEDGIIVSETFARKMGAYKIYAEKWSVPADAHVTIHKSSYPMSDARSVVKHMSRSRSQGTKGTNEFMLRRGEKLMTMTYYDHEGNPMKKEFVTNVKSDSVLVRIEKFIPATDLDEVSMTYRFVALVYYPLEPGDKVSDGHGNKATISAIWPDMNMPIWEGGPWRERAHYIATPYVMKRLALGAEIEDKRALSNYIKESIKDDIDVLDSGEIYSLEDANQWMEEAGIPYLGKVVLGKQESENVPLSMRRMFRLDNNVRDTLNSRPEVLMDEYRRTTRNARMGIDVLTMLTRGAKILVHRLIEQSGSRQYMQRTVVPMLYALENEIPEGAATFEITKRLDRDLLGNPYSSVTFSKIDFTDTVCDLRIANGMYGIINLGKDKRIIVPPHQPISDLGNGSMNVGRIAIYANRVLAERLSRDQGYYESTNVDVQVDRYRETLANLLSSKNGLIRDALLPVFPTTIRAVVSAYMTDDPLEVALPQSEFNRLMRTNPQFRAIYKNKDNWHCIVKRDPVHRCQNLITVKFTLWNKSSIGVSPLLISSVDGDFDGDTMFAMFATDRDAFEDMKKLIPDFKDIFSPSKHLTDAHHGNAVALMRERIGWSSSFDIPHEMDEVKNKVLYEKLIHGISKEDLSAECISAARDFEIIKDGTASTGALGLSFIFSRRPDQKHLVHEAMELYHLLAQNTLDAKSGVEKPALKVVQGVRFGSPKLIRQGLDELGFTHKECREQFMVFAKSVKEVGGRLKYLTSEFPVLGIMQRGAYKAQAYALSKRFVTEPTMGDGVWEAMMDFLLLDRKNTPYEWTEEEQKVHEKEKVTDLVDQLRSGWGLAE